ncbi:putative asparagine synthetase [Magnetofaba australis IT-1]|uniref:asparagine synthase (glutamine-hydrolyzing) n=2 Tax=Magnetofaba TaxID=1472292 RepID=A0A1Y2K2A4_9PROT|nr:putative asparagine synthetase [Magnetofaba australis IT-1]
MNRVQRHRGPDGDGVFEDPRAPLNLGHVRLSILDLTPSAAQPMHSADGRYVLSYNGEIYNFRELRAQLEAKGRTFRSSGDTEVLLQGLAEEGAAFLPRLNGMYALALWDRLTGSLLLARDPIGVKPLYYAQIDPRTLVFASEIKTLCAHPKLLRRPNFAAIQQHLSYIYASGEHTALQDVMRLPAGATLQWRPEGVEPPRIERFFDWRLGPTDAQGINAPQAYAQESAHLRDALATAVSRQMVADTPVGSLLSGGLDSSLITALANRDIGAALRCFTITTPTAENQLDQAADDAPYARQLAADLHLPLHEIALRPKVADLWPQLVWHLDEPLSDPAAISCYLVSKLARDQGVPVLLSGQGADELFCGYPRYWAMQQTRGLDTLPQSARHLLAGAARLLPGARPGRLGALSRRVRRVLSEAALPPQQRFLNLCANTPQSAMDAIYTRAFADQLHGERGIDACYAAMTARPESLEQAQRWRDLTVYLPNHNLNYLDKMGMAQSIEARVPLLDLEITARAARYPANWLVQGRVIKRILRSASQGIVPDAIIHRRKAGFGAPYRKWLRHDLAPMWEDVSQGETARTRGWFDPAALAQARTRSQEGVEDLYMLQWGVLTTELWARAFLDRNPATDSP